MLARERQERNEDAELFSKMLLKVTEAEAEAKTLRERVHELEAALADRGPTESAMHKHIVEMRELLTRAAELFDDLDRREQAISEFRSRGLQDARALLLRAGARDNRITPPPIPIPIPSSARADEVDISEMAEMVDSMRPPKPKE